MLEKPEIGFRFEDSPLNDGRQRVIGKAPRGTALVELIGAPNNLTKAVVIAGMAKDDVSINQLSAVYILGMLNLVLPAWDGAESWITESVTQLANTDLSETSTMQYGKRIKLEVDKKLGLITLVISPIQ